jgi:hypothetical protein
MLPYSLFSITIVMTCEEVGFGTALGKETEPPGVA